ncbi:nascent polypeptide-associated complex protein [Candidatus Micrarchaeota archaeon]|nr:nascent polypeptide-associated complex protein [Candidatus Micrarchaeota archaeon]MBU1165511.1 nascent polypeptide-associated complex protein [Candidatus Micrarchaeota archaeon]MBU1887409.1 nascent polypeptide-associated complex protein [Candidatus Micrarchaeota archaeon]
MIPGGVDPRKMEAMMRQMGIKSENMGAISVIIETPTERFIVSDPQVTKITMQGQISFQVAGEISKEEKSSENDIKMIIEQTGCSEEGAKAALIASDGDIAQAILSFSQDKE